MNDVLVKTFKHQNNFVMLGWAALVLLPSWHYMPMVVVAIVLLICFNYSFLIFFGHRYDGDARKPKVKDFTSLKGVMKLFTNPRAVLGGWLHYLAFDLLVGLIIVMDSQQHEISHGFIVPILFFSLMFGPMGLALYFVFRAVYTGNFLDFSMI